jgi:peptide/nickel transport system permease protein
VTTLMSTQTLTPTASRRSHPLRSMLLKRSAQGVVTLLVVSMLVFWATQLLPGNAANAVLGKSATPETLAALEEQLGLNKPVIVQYWSWLSGLLTGNPGSSLINGDPVGVVVSGRLLNSAFLLVVAGVIGTAIAVSAGMLAASRRDRAFDHTSSITALVVTALPEFVVAVVLILAFSTQVFKILPATSPINPGSPPWQQPTLLVLPIITLIIVIVPYMFRMVRAVTIETLESDYVQTARLKGLNEPEILLRHVLPNIVPASVQAVGLTILYLAGGVVVVEVVFNYPGVGQGLVQAVATRDIPVIQFLVMLLAAFYVAVNIGADFATLVATPKRRVTR